jgi:hypothetical protein
MTSGAHGEGIFEKKKKREREGGGWAGWAQRGRGAAGPAGPKGEWGRREGGRKKRFSFSKIYFPLNECIHILKQPKGMHGPAWCITQNKIF